MNAAPSKRNRSRTLVWFLGLLFVVSLGLAQSEPHSADGWYNLGRSALARGDAIAAERAFQEAVKLNPTAANWRWLAEARVKLKEYDGASFAYDAAILKYRALGDALTANALRNLSNPYRQQGEFYLLNQPVPRPETLARLEPAAGLLLGSYVDETGITRGGDLEIPRRLGTGLAVYFRYHKLIRPQDATASQPIFPSRLANAARKFGGALHLALEPNMPLSQVTEAIVIPFAQRVREAGLPVFVRFASEFNDPESPWGKDPKLFVEKFRLVADVLHRIAPNAATVWMPMSSRLEVLDRYYPGREYVDWAGLSLYSTPYSNGNLKQSNLRVSPLDAIKPFYDKYARWHPIQISEYAASSETALAPEADFTRFAVTKMRMLYWGAMLRFPRLKNINWLDIDMLRSRYITPSRAAERRNDYSLYANPAKLEAFQELLLEPYFVHSLDDPALTAPRSLTNSPLTSLPANTPNLELAAWVKTYEPFVARVEFRLDGERVATTTTMPYRFKLMPLSKGSKVLELRAFDAKGQLLLKRVQRITAR